MLRTGKTGWQVDEVLPRRRRVAYKPVVKQSATTGKHADLGTHAPSRAVLAGRAVML